MDVNKSSAEPLGGKNSAVRVLVVDDDEKIIRFISISLKLAGFVVITATNSEQALKLLKSEKPDIMVLDILMPVIDGFEVLRKTRTFSDLPVIAISAHDSAVKEASRLGANDFMVKPFKPDELVTKIKALTYHQANGNT